jgi:hypothetical protein
LATHGLKRIRLVVVVVALVGASVWTAVVARRASQDACPSSIVALMSGAGFSFESYPRRAAGGGRPKEGGPRFRTTAPAEVVLSWLFSLDLSTTVSASESEPQVFIAEIVGGRGIVTIVGDGFSATVAVRTATRSFRPEVTLWTWSKDASGEPRTCVAGLRSRWNGRLLDRQALRTIATCPPDRATMTAIDGQAALIASWTAPVGEGSAVGITMLGALGSEIFVLGGDEGGKPESR